MAGSCSTFGPRRTVCKRGGRSSAGARRYGRLRRTSLRELAYGDLKRLELAIALANQPKLLLMDEPTAGMAPRERIELMRLTAGIARQHSIGVLFHRARHGCGVRARDRILVLNRGTLIAEGSPEEVRRNPQVRAIYLGEGLV